MAPVGDVGDCLGSPKVGHLSGQVRARQLVMKIDRSNF